MENPKFQRAAQFNRAKAVMFTAIFHVLIIGGILYSNNQKFSDLVPENVKELLGMDTSDEEGTQKNEKVARP